MSKQIIKRVLKVCQVHKVLHAKRYLAYVRDFTRFKKRARRFPNRFTLSWKNRYPCLHDQTTETYFDRHYVYHTGWAARILARTKPELHIDISSSLYFVSIASAFVPIKFYDYRPAKLELSNLSSGVADLLELPFETNSVKSLSCMHVVEHVGLGRYGDPLDPQGDLQAIAELERVLAPRGSLLFVVPVGKPQVMFNAHRVYSYKQIRNAFSKLTLKEFALIPQHATNGELLYNPPKARVAQETYGCGCFWFTKK